MKMGRGTMKANIESKGTLKTIYDSFSNLMSGIGGAKDKRTGGTFSWERYTWRELEEFYISSMLARKSVDIIAEDMTSKGRIITNGIEPDQMELFCAEESRLRLWAKYAEAIKIARAYGGSAIVLGLDGTGDPSTELNLDLIKEGALKQVHVVDPSYIFPRGTKNRDFNSANFLTPDYWSFQEHGGHVIHESRIIRFHGDFLPRRKYEQNNFHHASIFYRLDEAIRDATNGAANIAALLQEAKLNVIGIDGLLETSQDDQATTGLINRFLTANVAKSTINTLLIDRDNEEFHQHNAQFSGAPDAARFLFQVVAAAVDIPEARYLGTPVGGMSADDQSSMRNYYDRLKSNQETDFFHQIWRMDEILTRSVFGEMPEEWEFEFNPLQTMSPKEQAELENQKADRDQKYFNMGVINENIIAQQLAAEGTYVGVDAEYVSELEKIVKEEQEAAAREAEMAEERTRRETFNIPDPDAIDEKDRAAQDTEDSKQFFGKTDIQDGEK